MYVFIRENYIGGGGNFYEIIYPLGGGRSFWILSKSFPKLLPPPYLNFLDGEDGFVPNGFEQVANDSSEGLNDEDLEELENDVNMDDAIEDPNDLDVDQLRNMENQLWALYEHDPDVLSQRMDALQSQNWDALYE